MEESSRVESNRENYELQIKPRGIVSRRGKRPCCDHRKSSRPRRVRRRPDAPHGGRIYVRSYPQSWSSAPARTATAATSAPAVCAPPTAPLLPLEPVVAPFVAFLAFARKASKVLPLDGALIAKTMPALQWLFGLVCLQYTQTGADWGRACQCQGKGIVGRVKTHVVHGDREGGSN